ncbi:MAG: Fic family protein [Nitrospinae bacterium]|nr:Fic family protein [Nitrospinota bacterium]
MLYQYKYEIVNVKEGVKYSVMMDWDKFSFEYRLELNQEDLFRSLIAIEASKEASLNLVLAPEWQTQLDKLNRVRAVYGTTALEGNPLSEAEVSEQMESLDTERYKVDLAKMTKEQLQIRNAGMAQAWVKRRFEPGTSPISLGDIFEMHQTITQVSDTHDNEPGKLRTFSVTVGSSDMGGVHRGAPYSDLPHLMKQYIEFINSPRLMETHAVIKALLAHFFLITIHPFGDGNGRVSRLVEAGILFQAGYNVHGFYGLSNYFYHKEREYKTLLQKCRQKQPFEVAPFIHFGVTGFAKELKGINNFVKTKINRVVYRAMLVKAYNKRVTVKRRVLNQREYHLLEFLLTETEPSDPFSENPSKIIRLSELQQSQYIQFTYRDVTQRTFGRELIRLGQNGFIKFTRDEELKDWTVELDFGAITKY